MCDLNARVCNNVTRWEGVIRKQDEAVENDSGRLLSLSAENSFKILNTYCEHKEIHKHTWICPGRGLQSIIDYFLIRGDVKRNVNVVKVIRGTEIGSDHHLVLMKLKLCGRVPVRKVEKQSSLRSERLTTEVGKLKYQIRLGHKLNEAKWMNGSDVEKMWEEFKNNAIETAEVVGGRIKYWNRNQRTRWWGKEVELSVRKKKLAFKRWLQLKTTEAKEEYLRAKRAAGHEVRKAKNDEWRRLGCLLYTSPSPRDRQKSRMPSSA